jgi:carboxypeptidase family protein
MILAARTILPVLAICLVILAAANTVATQGTRQPPKEIGGSTVRGVVTYADTGRPLRNARVMLLANDNGPGTTIGITDFRGEFMMRHVPAGRFALIIDAPGILKPQEFGRAQSQLIARFRLSDNRDLFTEVVVNGTDSVNVKLQALRGGVITGRVLSEDDQPLADANVKILRSENGKWLPVPPGVDLPSDEGLKTDAKGVYRIAGLPSGDYLVCVHEASVGTDGKPIEEGGYVNGQLMVAYYPSATNVKDAQAITVVEASESTGIDIRLPDRAAYTISGRIFGPNNEPAGYGEVIVGRTDAVGDVDEWVQTRTTSETDGSWRLTGVPAGDYVITMGGSIRVGTPEDGGYLAVLPKTIKVRVENGDVVVPDVKLGYGATVAGKITVDGKVPKRAYGLFPELVMADEENARVAVNLLAPGRFRYATNDEYVKEDGSFRMLAVAPGKYWFQLPWRAEEGMYLNAVTRKGVDLMQSPFKVTSDTVLDDVVFALATDFATIEGELAPPSGKVDAAQKRSARDVTIVLAPATEATRRNGGRKLLMVQPDTQGRFSFSCAPGEYFVTAFTSAQVKNLPGPLNDEYFKKDTQKFTRVKVRAAEKLKGLTIPVDFKN